TNELYEYIITGDRPVDGSDVIVSPFSNGENPTVDIPLYVLRDPPGDHSYSYIAKETEFATVIESSLDIASDNVYSLINEGELGVLVLNSQSNWKVTIGDETRKTQKIGFRAKEKITTAQKSTLSTNLRKYLDGSEADVIIGAGLAYKYGMVDVLSRGEGCEIAKTQTLNISVDEIKTTWQYTRSMIKQSIKYYDSLAAKVSSGRIEIKPINELVQNDIGEESSISALDLRRISDGWKDVLLHLITQNPAVQLNDRYETFADDQFIKNVETTLYTFVSAGVDRDFLFTDLGKTKENGANDEVIQAIVEAASQLQTKLDSYKTTYARVEQRVKDANVTLADSLDGFSPTNYFSSEDYETFNEAYEAYRKLEMLLDLTLQLTAVNGATSVDLEELLFDTEIFDEATGYASNNTISKSESAEALQSLLIASVSSRAAITVGREAAFAGFKSTYDNLKSVINSLKDTGLPAKGTTGCRQ
ncbi:MAG: hypothetical protein AAFY41_12080, partial [Bacteroidota bacterium]